MRSFLSSGRPVRFGGGVLGLALLISTPAPAQTPAASGAPDAAPLARFVPGEKLMVYAEFAGLDAHADAWHKTAAYKMLNDTSLGAMLEDLGAQAFDKAILTKIPSHRVTGAESIAIIKHVARSGFVFGASGDPKDPTPDCVVLVLRGGATKEIRGPVSKMLLSAGKPDGKPKLVKKGARSIVVMPSQSLPESWAWWAEKNDLIVALEASKSIDAAIELIDGKRKNAVDHPLRAGLLKAEGEFTPVGIAFIDPVLLKDPKAPPQFQAAMGAVKGIDYRWGFQNDAIMSISRLKLPSPRQGLFALFDEPKFDKSSLPPLPPGLEGFTAFSLDVGKMVDTMTNLAKSSNPQAMAKVEEAMKASKGKSKIDLQKDVLAHLGPKMAFYLAPKPAAADKPEGGGGMPSFDPISMMLGQIPKFVLITEVDNPDKFAKTFDELIFMINRGLRDAAGGMGAPPGPPPDPGGAGGPAPKSRSKPASGPAPEFKMLQGKGKTFALNLPSELGKLPAGIKPTLKLVGNHLVFAINPSVAALALESKEKWEPTGDYAAVFAQLPPDLIFLNVGDPRGTMPAALASLPRGLQTAINTALAPSNPFGAGATSPGGAFPGGPGAAPGGFPGAPNNTSPPGAPGTTSAGASSTPSSAPGGLPGTTTPSSTPSSAPGGLPGAPGASSTPSSAPGGLPGAPGGAGAPTSAPGGVPGGSPPGGFPGAPGGAGPGGPPLIVFQVDPAKMPSADSLKTHLFPGSMAVSVTAEEIRFVSRVAFPNISPSSSPLSTMFVESFKKQMQAQMGGGKSFPGGPGAAPGGFPAPGGAAPAPGGFPPPGGASGNK